MGGALDLDTIVTGPGGEVSSGDLANALSLLETALSEEALDGDLDVSGIDGDLDGSEGPLTLAGSESTTSSSTSETYGPTPFPTLSPSVIPTMAPSSVPSDVPSDIPSQVAASAAPSTVPSDVPSSVPRSPIAMPSDQPSDQPSILPTVFEPFVILEGEGELAQTNQLGYFGRTPNIFDHSNSPDDSPPDVDASTTMETTSSDEAPTEETTDSSIEAESLRTETVPTIDLEADIATPPVEAVESMEDEVDMMVPESPDGSSGPMIPQLDVSTNEVDELVDEHMDSLASSDSAPLDDGTIEGDQATNSLSSSTEMPRPVASSEEVYSTSDSSIEIGSGSGSSSMLSTSLAEVAESINTMFSSSDVVFAGQTTTGEVPEPVIVPGYYSVSSTACHRFQSIRDEPDGVEVTDNLRGNLRSGSAPLRIPFPFPAFGYAPGYQDMAWSADGTLFLNQTMGFGNVSPIVSDPTAFFQMDKLPRIQLAQEDLTVLSVYTLDKGSSFVLSYEDAIFSNSENLATRVAQFQIELYPSGDFEIRWGTMLGSSTDHISSGIEDESVGLASPAVLDGFFNEFGITAPGVLPDSQCNAFTLQRL